MVDEHGEMLQGGAWDESEVRFTSSCRCRRVRSRWTASRELPHRAEAIVVDCTARNVSL